MRQRYLLYFLAATTLLPAIANGQGVTALHSGKPAATKDQPPTVKLVLQPAPEPRPALKYVLLPPITDRRPGNAAVWYGKVTAEQRQFFGNTELWEKIDKWLEAPLAEIPKDEIRKSLTTSAFQFLDKAARRDTVDWELPIREEEFISILLPDLQQTRSFGRMLALKAKLEIAEGKFDDAVHTLQTGYALANHVGQGPTLINGLVGIAIAELMSKQVQLLAQQPKAPNLYWALTQLPEPLVDVRHALDAERAMVYLSYPELRDLDTKKLSPEEWRQLLNKTVAMVTRWTGPNREGIDIELMTTAGAIYLYPIAKQNMIQRGYAPAEVDAMTVPQVLLVNALQNYNESRDEMFKWFALPYWQARPGLAKVDERLRDEAARKVNPIGALLLPAIGNVRFAVARHERSIAALRVIEAIRLYGAAHNGQLPETLGEITQVPIPIDPVTGQAFVYHKDGAAAILESPPPPGMPAEHFGLRYELTFAPKGK